MGGHGSAMTILKNPALSVPSYESERSNHVSAYKAGTGLGLRSTAIKTHIYTYT